METPPEVQGVIEELSRDPRYVGTCPFCDEAFPMKDSHLFYSSNFNSEGENSKKRFAEELSDLRREYEELKTRILQGAPKKSLEVIFGQVAEKVAPVMPRFPFEIDDCRFLGQPIDYVIFDGLTAETKVNEIVFADVKTGDAGLNTHQKQTKSAVDEGRVSARLY